MIVPEIPEQVTFQTAFFFLSFFHTVQLTAFSYCETAEQKFQLFFGTFLFHSNFNVLKKKKQHLFSRFVSQLQKIQANSKKVATHNALKSQSFEHSW